MMRLHIGPATLVLGDARELTLAADAVITDPPYGIGYEVNARGARGFLKGADVRELSTAPAPAVAGDDAPFDPTPWLAYGRCAFFGANHFSDQLPTGRWLVWDKRRDSVPDAHSDCELLWLSGDHREASRVHRQKWRGIVREGEENLNYSPKLHQNQKPVALLARVIAALGLVPGEVVLDPFMGSGSTGVAAMRAGLRFVGVEIDPKHFETASRRLEREWTACQAEFAL